MTNVLVNLTTSSVPPRIQYLAVVASVVLLLTVIHLIRRGYLKEGYSIIWFLIGLGTVVVAVFSRLLDGLAQLIGVSYTPAALFLILLGALFVLSIHFSILVTRHDKQIRELAQEHAILKAHVMRHSSQEGHNTLV